MPDNMNGTWPYGVEVITAEFTAEHELIAQRCAKGPRQLYAVEVLLKTGQLQGKRVPIPGRSWGHGAIILGDGLTYQSWKSLRKRLEAAGFQMAWSPANTSVKNFTWIGGEL